MADVHLNLRQGGFSVLEGGVKVAHRHALEMTGRFVVQPAGSERAKDEGRRNVHAFVRGTVNDEHYGRIPNWDLTGWREVTYNPFTDTAFRFRDTDEYIAPEQVFPDIRLTRKPDGKYGVFVPRTE